MNTQSAHFLQKVLDFDGIQLPESAWIAGYAAIIRTLGLSIPRPQRIALVSETNKRESEKDWFILPKAYLPEDAPEQSLMQGLFRQLVFALKYEGINLLVFKAVTDCLTPQELSKVVHIDPTGQYSRRIWFIFEWLMGSRIPGKPDLKKKSYIPVVDTNLQFAVKGAKSKRHLVINNLPGTVQFCPLIHKTPALSDMISTLSEPDTLITGTRRDLLQRVSAFLLLKDSRASFTIEGESPKSKRAVGWGRALSKAGENKLSREEFQRLQKLVIENSRFTDMGYRRKGGFVGDHGRETGFPVPDHISARWQDLDTLIEGLLMTAELLINDDTFNPVIAAAAIAFGFVFIHPFQDGNGRIHRYLIHDILAKKRFSPQGMVFPVSASILDRISDYRRVLEHFSHPLLEYIEWGETVDHNVEVLNETVDFYRYFDATVQTEFLFECVKDTIQTVIPREIKYLIAFDNFKAEIDDKFEMP